MVPHGQLPRGDVLGVRRGQRAVLRGAGERPGDAEGGDQARCAGAVQRVVRGRERGVQRRVRQSG